MNPRDDRMLVTLTLGELQVAVRDCVRLELEARKPPAGRWGTVGSVAEHFGTTRQTIHNWIKAGAPARQIGTSARPQYRIELAEFEAWVRSQGR